MSIFGRIVPTPVVAKAVTDTLALWIDTELGEVERQTSETVGTIARPKAYEHTYDWQNWQEGQTPALLVICNDTSSVERQGDQQYGAWFDVKVGCMVVDVDEPTTLRVAGYYQAAVELALLQNGTLEPVGFASETHLMGRTIELPDAANRTLAVAVSEFRVFVDEVVTAYAGPATPTPPTPPIPGAWPTISSTHVTLDAEPASEDLSNT